MTDHPFPFLLFVYNSDSGFFNTLSDIAHKVISPKTYRCSLCRLTHGNFKVKSHWLQFLNELNIECKFLHSDEFHRVYPEEKSELPSVFFVKDDRMISIFNRKEMDQFISLEEFQSQLKFKTAEYL
ncbi:MAG: hypothetical protein OEZ34_03095 [Spirochaetia bacterium]|nr:hypothetical protein [Spirochaetia bacterium]